MLRLSLLAVSPEQTKRPVHGLRSDLHVPPAFAWHRRLPQQL